MSAVQGPVSPPPRLSYPEPFSRPAQYGTLWPMAMINRAIVHRTWGLHTLAACANHDDNTKRLTYGDEFTYEESIVLPMRGRIPAIFFSLGIIVTTVVLSVVTPVSV